MSIRKIRTVLLLGAAAASVAACSSSPADDAASTTDSFTRHTCPPDEEWICEPTVSGHKICDCESTNPPPTAPPIYPHPPILPLAPISIDLGTVSLIGPLGGTRYGKTVIQAQNFGEVTASFEQNFGVWFIDSIETPQKTPEGKPLAYPGDQVTVRFSLQPNPFDVGVVDTTIDLAIGDTTAKLSVKATTEEISFLPQAVVPVLTDTWGDLQKDGSFQIIAGVPIVAFDIMAFNYGDAAATARIVQLTPIPNTQLDCYGSYDPSFTTTVASHSGAFGQCTLSLAPGASPPNIPPQTYSIQVQTQGYSPTYSVNISSAGYKPSGGGGGGGSQSTCPGNAGCGCGNGQGCKPGLVCLSGTCLSCGGEGEACCANNGCSGTLECLKAPSLGNGYACLPCGSNGAACCAGGRCNGGSCIWDTDMYVCKN